MKTYADVVDRNAAYFPNADAFVLEDRRLTYRQYTDRSRRLGASLYALGLRQQDRLGILSTNNIEYFEAYGACELSGYIAAVYNFRCAAPELAHLFRDSAPGIVIFESAFAGLIDGLRERFKDIHHWICIGNDVPSWALAYEELIQRGDPSGAPIRARPEDIAYLFYTSGTTGAPKGVPWSQAAALEVSRNEGRKMGDDTRLLQLTPAFHVGGKGFPLGAAWLAGKTVLDRGGFDPARFLSLVERERITYTFMVPAMMQAVLDYPQLDHYDVSSLRSVMAASTAIPVPLLRRAVGKFGSVFFVAYGSTETGNIAALPTHEMRPDGTPEELKRLGSVGHIHPETEAVLLDDEGRVCAPNQVGEVCVKSRVFRGYWNNSIATIEATRYGWVHTGDLGYLDEAVYLYLLHRKKDMIISGGENIYSREVEEALYRHPAVIDVAVIGVPDEKWGETVKAIVVLRQSLEAGEAELIAFCQTQIARYKCPKSIVIAPELPRLGTGKIDKVSLRKTIGESR